VHTVSDVKNAEVHWRDDLEAFLTAMTDDAWL
jgi:hypothetical protein